MSILLKLSFSIYRFAEVSKKLAYIYVENGTYLLKPENFIVFYLKIAIIYSILFAITASLTIATSFNNPALAFFVPSVLAMMIYGKLKLGGEKVNVMKHAFICGWTFATVTVLVSFILQGIYGWLKSPQLLYFMAFGGNLLFPFLLFPKIRKVQG